MSIPRTSTEPRALAPAVGALLALGVFASHLPFLLPGYGTDTDAWKLANALRNMVETGHYTSSRMPGYPVMELASLLFMRWGPWATNALSALASTWSKLTTASPSLCSDYSMP